MILKRSERLHPSNVFDFLQVKGYSQFILQYKIKLYNTYLHWAHAFLKLYTNASIAPICRILTDVNSTVYADSVAVTVVVETKDSAHAKELEATLRHKYRKVRSLRTFYYHETNYYACAVSHFCTVQNQTKKNMIRIFGFAGPSPTCDFWRQQV